MTVDKEKSLASAQKHAEKEQYDKAIREILPVVELDKRDSRVLLRLASYYEKAHKYQDAAETYLAISDIFRDQGAYQKSLAVLKQAQRYLPQDNAIAFKAADLYSALGLPHEAVVQLEHCLTRAEAQNDVQSYGQTLQMMVRVDGENVQSRTKYARHLLDKGDIEGTIRQYSLALAQLLSKDMLVDYVQTAREYLKIVPKDADVLKNIASIYIKMNRYNEAIVILSDLDDSERTPEIFEILITCYTQLKRFKDAVREYKKLAKRYESLGMQEDLIRDVWLRAQKLDPNDNEISIALGAEPPMLSDSALNFVDAGLNIPPPKHPDNEAKQKALSEQFTQALIAYRQGNNQHCLQTCLAIIAEDEQHLPALRLLAELYENLQDNAALAHIERKIALAVYESDLDEAIRHILRAEKYTPRAWDNFNLMLFLGVEPAKYGMHAPETTHNSSPLIPTSKSAQFPSIPSIPRTPSRPSLPPPIPKMPGHLPPLPNAVAPIPVPSVGDKVLRTRPILKTIDIPGPIQALSPEVLNQLKGLEDDSLSLKQSNPRFYPSAKQGEASAFGQGEYDLGYDPNEDSLFSPASASVEAALNDVFTDLFNDDLFEDHSKQNFNEATPNPSPPKPEIEKRPAELSAVDLRRIDECIKEAEFFASLDLIDDATKLLTALCREFDDHPTIKAAQERLKLNH